LWEAYEQIEPIGDEISRAIARVLAPPDKGAGPQTVEHQQTLMSILQAAQAQAQKR